ncbi:MAG: arylsulfatase [Mucinivorans sp.]
MIGYNNKIAQRYPHELPRMMNEAGYATVAVGKMHYWPQRNGHGFQKLYLDESGRVESDDFVSDYRQWFSSVAPGVNPDSTGLDWNGHDAKRYALADTLHPTHWTASVAVEQIEQYCESKPLFLKVSFARPHSPYDPPQRYIDMYTEDSIAPPWIGDWCEKYGHAKPSPTAAFGNFGIPHAIKSRAHYYASITFIDQEIGRVIKALKEKGLYENSVIIFTSDHGDMLGDHHHWRKTYPYEGSSHIPFIMKTPHNKGAGTIRQECVDLRDIMPTFLSAAGINVPECVDGSSLLELVKNGKHHWREYIEMEHSACYGVIGGWVALTDGVMKYIWFYNTASEQLFDLSKDPHELQELSKNKEYTRALALWRTRMIALLTERGTEWVRNGELQKVESHSPTNHNYPK